MAEPARKRCAKIQHRRENRCNPADHYPGTFKRPRGGYTGISNDVQRRVADHNKGRGCRFTKCRYPVILLYQEYCGTKSSARRREMEVKNLTRQEKLELIEGRM